MIAENRKFKHSLLIKRRTEKSYEMSDEWAFYPCQMGEHTAWIFFDDGIRHDIDQDSRTNLLNVRAAFKSPQADGMYMKDEFAPLSALEHDLKEVVEKHESFFVGRVTVDRHRHFYIYTNDSEQHWAPRIQALERRHDYRLSTAFESDSTHQGYWRDLAPTDDDRQVINDLKVLEQLREHNDDGSASRRVDHWVYFPTSVREEEFCAWLTEHGYENVKRDPTKDGQTRVCFSHEGTLELTAITSHTIALRRKASELGGDYDGWETPVMANESE